MGNKFDHPWLSGLLHDAEVAALWSAETQLSHMLAFEAAWSRAGHHAELWSQTDGEAAANAIGTTSIDPFELADGTGRDGVCVPTLVELLKTKTGHTAIHDGATSQDVIDTATALSATATLDVLDIRLAQLKIELETLISRFGENRITGRTRMQLAETIAASDRIHSWKLPLIDNRTRLTEVRPRLAVVQIGGATGNRNALGSNAAKFCEVVASELGLSATEMSWHTRRDGLAEFASVLSLITGTLGKLGQDVALMSQQGIREIEISVGGRSSAMPHKQNPVNAELLITLARFNAVQLSGMHQALVHEQERSGAAWMLEWMILPQMAEATGRALIAATDLARSVVHLGMSEQENRN